MATFKTEKGTELPLLNMRGKPYLQVAHRLVWFREVHPDWSIETELRTASDGKSTIARAVIKNPDGRIMSTAHKREDEKGFQDHGEKAETGAIGRALAMVGYGTQFCADELEEGTRLADSPTQPQRPAAPRPQTPRPQPTQPHRQSGIPDFASFNSQPMTESDVPF